MSGVGQVDSVDSKGEVSPEMMCPYWWEQA